MNGILITNNPAAAEKYSAHMETAYLEGASLADVLHTARDKIHVGHRLLTHPLSGSVKPGQTPYKSLVVSEERGDLDMDSLRIIEDSIAVADRQAAGQCPEKFGGLLEDYQLIDLSLISSAIDL